jgi:transcriptional regulator with XRE-family HTH domain
LLDARKRAGLSQRALAERAGTAQSVVARIELGATSPTTDTLRRLLDAAGFELGMSLLPKLVLDPQELDDVPRILGLTPEQRLREVANIDRLVAAARRG